MIVKFNGIIEKRKNGCPVCGGHRTGSKFLTMKSYILPSGMTKMFRAGTAEEVTDEDGEFLLSYKFVDQNGEVRNVFEVV